MKISKQNLANIGGQILVIFDKDFKPILESTIEASLSYDEVESGLNLSNHSAYGFIDAFFNDKFDGRLRISMAKYRRTSISDLENLRVKISLEYDKKFLKFLHIDPDLPDTHNTQVRITLNVTDKKSLSFNVKLDNFSGILQSVIELTKFEILKNVNFGAKLDSITIQNPESSNDGQIVSKNQGDIFFYSSNQNLFENFGGKQGGILDNVTLNNKG